MKKLLFGLMLLVCGVASAQVVFLGGGTTAEIDGLTIPAGRSTLIYNETLSQYGFENSASTWFRIISGQDIDTFAELDAIVADQSLLNQAQIDTYSELNTIVADQTLTHNGLIDTFAEIDAIVADQSLATTSSAQTLTNKTIDADNNTVSNIGSAEITNGSIDETDLDTSVNASLDLADSAYQANDNAIFTNLDASVFTSAQTTTTGNWLLGQNAGSRDWLLSSSSGDILFNWETGNDTGFYSNAYTLDGDGDPTDATDLTDKAYVDAQVSGVTQESTTVSDTAEIDLTLSGVDISGALVAGSIDETKLDASVNASLDLADSASQTDDQTAAEVSIADSGGQYDATDVEGALSEAATDIAQNSQSIGSISSNTSDNSQRLDSVVTVLSTIPSSQFSFDSYTANQTVVSTSLADNKIVKLDYNDEDFTIHKDSIGEGQALRIILDDAAAGVANIAEGDSVSILGYTDGITLNSYPSGVTLMRKNSTTSPAREFIVTDYFGSISDWVSCSAAAGELWTFANPSSDPNCNESNSTSGFTTSGSPTLTAETTGVDTGTYSLSVTATGTGSAFAYQTSAFTVTSGNTYTWSGRFKKTQGTAQYAFVSSGATFTGSTELVAGSSGNTLTTAWQTFNGSFTATSGGTMFIRFYAINGSGSVGDDIWIDNFTIVETTP